MADNKNTQAADVNEQIKIRMDKLKALQDAGKDPFQITKYDVTHHTDEIRAIYEAHEKELLGDRPAVNTEGLDEQQAREAVNADYNERRAIMDASPIEVSFAGRMMFKRVMGKASFCNIADLKGKMQAYISKDAIGEEADLACGIVRYTLALWNEPPQHMVVALICAFLEGGIRMCEVYLQTSVFK